MKSDLGLQGIVNDITSLASDLANSDHDEYRHRDISRTAFLSFLTKVSHVVEQAFREILIIFIEVKMLTPETVRHDRLDSLRRDVKNILNRSHYRDAEEICSRLAHLREYYDTHFHRYLQLDSRSYGLLGLLNERESRIIYLIESAVRQIEYNLDNINGSDPYLLQRLTREASDHVTSLKKELRILSDFTNQVLGLSGLPGLLELMSDGVVRPTIYNDDRSVTFKSWSRDMSKNYNVGQGVILADNAKARDVNAAQNISYSIDDFSALKSELAKLRKAMKEASDDAEHDAAIGFVAIAETAASKKMRLECRKHWEKPAVGPWILRKK